MNVENDRQQEANRLVGQSHFIILHEGKDEDIEEFNFNGKQTPFEFGLDFISMTVAPPFQGMKLIPYGFHYLRLGTPIHDPYGRHASPLKSFFFLIQNSLEQQVLLFKYLEATEEWQFVSTPSKRDAIREKYQVLDPVLAPFHFYETEKLKDWSFQSQFITKFSLSRCFRTNPLLSEDFPVVQFSSMTSSHYSSSKKYSSSSTKVEELVLDTQDSFQFTDVSMKRFIKESRPKLSAESCLDTSSALTLFLKQDYLSDPLELLGDLQIAWLILIYGQNLEGLDHWCAIVQLLCNAHNYLSKNRTLYLHLIQILDVQIRQIPQDLATSVIDPKNNIIGQALYVSLTLLYKYFYFIF